MEVINERISFNTSYVRNPASVVVLIGLDTHGEFANLTYFEEFLTYWELLECIDIEKLNVTRVCITGAVTSMGLTETDPPVETKPSVIRRPYGTTIIRDCLTIVNSDFSGTDDKKWGAGITWRLGIGMGAGSYHLMDLPTGSISVVVSASMEGTLKYKVNGTYTLSEKVANVLEWSYVQISSNTRKITGVVSTKTSSGTPFSVNWVNTATPVGEITLCAKEGVAQVNIEYTHLEFYKGFMTKNETQECLTPTFPSNTPSNQVCPDSMITLPLSEPA